MTTSTYGDKIKAILERVKNGEDFRSALTAEYNKAMEGVPLAVRMGGVLRYLEVTSMSAMRDILVEVEQRLEKADPTYRAEEDGYIQKRDLERDEARRREEALTEQRRIDDSVALGEMLLRVEEDLSAEDLLTAAGYDGWMTASIPMEDRGIIKKLVEVEAAHYDYAGVVCEERFVMSPLLKSHLEQDVAREVVG